MDGDFRCSCSLFTKSSFDKSREEAPHSDVFLISVDFFISLSTHLDEKKSTKRVAQQFYDARVKFFSLPYFRLQRLSSKKYRVIQHDGRHRAYLLQREGYKTMPVILLRSGKEVEDIPWPKTIQAQEDAKNPEFTVPLPPRLDPVLWPES
jgi:hypothetical protein